ncbi:MAG: hypothetical protein FJ398_16380 [Verrucomicrobia bacterium]|nr:hypothetical protein [Verrucomicrobiota bacterium]
MIYDYRLAPLSREDRALCDFAAKLTLQPGAMDKSDFDRLIEHHFTEEQITIAVQVIGYFNYINRVADRAAFLFVYIQEAHPADGWQMDSNETEGVIFNQPRDWGERQTVAKACSAKLKLSIPCVVDTLDNAVDNLYAAWPERMFVIDGRGKIAYVGMQGPWGFKPKQAERALRRLL